MLAAAARTRSSPLLPKDGPVAQRRVEVGQAIRGLNALLATVSTDTSAPVIAAQRLRTGSVGSSRGAARLAADTLGLIRRTHLAGRNALVRADSAFYFHALVVAVLGAGER
jgi:hypothetical protein